MVTEGSCPGTEGGLVWSRPAAGIWRLSSGQLRTHCLAGKLPRRRASLRVTCCGCVPWDLEWGEAGVQGRTSGPLTEFSASESSELLITTTRSSETGKRG